MTLRRGALLLLLVASVSGLLPGCGWLAGSRPTTQPASGAGGEPAAAPSARRIGITGREFVDGTFDKLLGRLDAATLDTQGRQVSVGEFHDTWSVSPDHRFVALGTGGQGLGITIFDLQRIRRVRAIRTGIAAQGLAWIAPDRLLAILQSNRLVVIDPMAGRVLRANPIPRGQTGCTTSPTDISSRTTGRGLLVLLRAKAPKEASRLVLAEADGRVRSVVLPSGTAWNCGRAGVVSAPDGRRALVISAGSEVVEVDLATMVARRHLVTGERLPEAASRFVSWVAGGKLVVSGRDDAGRATGVSILDTTSWRSESIDTSAGIAIGAGELVLAYDGDALALPNGTANGLTVYTAEGRERFQVLEGVQVNDVEVVARRAYAISERSVRAVDLSSGRVLSRRTASAARIDLTVFR